MKTVTLGAVSFAGSFNYYDSPNSWMVVSQLYAQDINGDGVDEIMFAGFETPANTSTYHHTTSVHIFGWQSGKLQDITGQWLPSNKVEGVDDVAYGDFNGDHKVDAILATYTNLNSPTHTYALMNQGDHFDKIDLGQAQLQHGITVYDINHDGYDDVVTTGFGRSNGSTTVYMGSVAGLISYTISAQSKYNTGGAGIALGDFLGNGTTTAVITDHQTSLIHAAADTILMQLKLNVSNHTFDLTPISTLPVPLLENSAVNPGGQSLDARAKTIDFNQDSLLDVIVFSRAGWNGTSWPELSAVQFLKNLGGGKFDDVTSMMLAGYKNDTGVAYSPIFSDFNDDGLIDIFLSSQTFSSPHDSTTLLLQQLNGSFLDTGRSTLSAAIAPGAGQATLAHGPDGKTFLVTEKVSQASPTGGLVSIVSSQEMTIGEELPIVLNPYLINGKWTVVVPDPANWATMGAADRDTIRPYLNPQNAFAVQLALNTEQRAQIVAENAAWVAQGHTLSLVGSYYDATYFNNDTWNNNVPTATDWAQMGAANRDIIRALLTMPKALAIRDQVTQEQWLTIVEENTSWAQQGHTLHAVGSAIPAPTQSPTGLHVDNTVVDYVNLNTDHTYQIDSGIRPTNCDWA
jgi:hypothetical protein